MKRPVGVTITAALTLLSTFALGFIYLMSVAASVVGMGGGLPLTLSNLPYYLPLFFGLFAFASSIAILSWVTSKYLWYLSIAYWVVLFIYFVWVYTSMGVWGYMFYMEGPLSTIYGVESVVRILLLPTPFIYTTGCTIYFFTEKPMEYFHVKK